MREKYRLGITLYTIDYNILDYSHIPDYKPWTILRRFIRLQMYNNVI